ncbi:S1 RNA-binding domain protein [Zavarzinella formosa]|uniref:S1 RNA-binding domain protein n=1 Tax=Zavarzinella formosa TaxID=360055 RepID=UPI00030E92B8|nr:S1 RNA-binding domain protein [Zavarzinella formosa]
MNDDADAAAPSNDVADKLFESLARSVQDVRNARVVRIDNNVMWLDIGFKFESALPLSAWQDGDSPPKVGDEFPVIVEDDFEVGDRPLTVARVRVRVTKRDPGWKFVANAKPGDIHSGRVTRRIEGGFLVDIGVNVFLPDERVRPGVLSDPEAFIGWSGAWRITKVDVQQMSIEIAPA